MEEDATLFTSDTVTLCHYNIANGVQNSDTILEEKSKIISPMGIHLQSKHKYRNVFGDSNIQYHDFNNGDALTFKDKYTVLLQQELQNLYWCLHDSITTKGYQISSEMDVETMPHAMYFSGSNEAIAKINQLQYQTKDYDDKCMFQAKVMDNTQVQIFIDNGTTPSILPLSIYNKYPILQKYPKTESHTHIHTGGGIIESHFWIEIPLKSDNQVIQIKALVCDSECPYDIVLGCTSLAQLSAWQDYASKQLYIQQISIPLIAKNNVGILPGQTGIISLVLKPSKTSFVPHHTITGKGIAYVRPFNLTLPLRPVEIEFENTRCLEVCNTSDSIIKFQYGHEVAYFDARSKGLVQINNSKHFPIDQYLHDRVPLVTLNPKPIAYDKPIDPAEMPHISTCTEMTTEGTNVPTHNDKFPWLEPDDKQWYMTDAEILQMKLNLVDCALDDKGGQEFLAKTDNFHDVFSLRDEIGTCPFIEVHLKLIDETPFLLDHIPCVKNKRKSYRKKWIDSNI